MLAAFNSTWDWTAIGTLTLAAVTSVVVDDLDALGSSLDVASTPRRR